MENKLQVFKNNEFGQVRMIEVKDKPYAVGSDVSKALGYAIPHKAVRDNCKGVLTWNIPTKGGKQEALIIPEGDIYRLVVKAADQSRNSKIKAKAEKFEKWIFDEVIPELRRIGSYLIKPNNSLQAIKLVNEQVGALLGTVEEIDERVDYLEDNMTVDFGQQRRLQNKAKSKALESLGGIESSAYKNKSIRSKVFSGIWRDYKDYFMIGSYRDTSRKEFDKGIEFLDNWQAQGKLLREIEECNNQLNLGNVM